MHLEPDAAPVNRTALVLAGGAARGAYEVGVADYILNDIARALGAPVQLDILCGTSVGALNACFLAAFADEPPAARASRLVAQWSGFRMGELVQLNPQGLLEARAGPARAHASAARAGYRPRWNPSTSRGSSVWFTSRFRSTGSARICKRVLFTR